MTDQTGAPGGEAITSVELPADAPESFSSANEAAAYYTSLKEKKPAESADAATADNELASQEADAAPDADQAHGEDQEADPVEEPLIERPKSWTESEEAEWRATPRALQQKIAARELERDTTLRRAQNETAEKLKGLTAKEQQAEQARQSYEARQAAYTQALETALQADFGDIQSLADVRKLQAEDPFRFQAWQVRQMELSTAQAEKQQVDSQKAAKHQTEWASFVRDESAAFADSVPEYKAKKADYDTKAAEVLRDIGFTDDELNKLASGAEKIPLFDRRIQRLLFDRIKLSEIQSATKAVAAKPVPPVLRPGPARPSGNVDSERLQALNRKSELTVKEATELYSLQQNSSRRRAS